MANYHAACRSNYFRVKDVDAFKSFMAKMPSEGSGWEVWEKDEFVAFGDYSSMPGDYFYDDEGNEQEIDFLDTLSSHLQPGEVCIIEEAGHEKLRYISGHAVAVNHAGETLYVLLSDLERLVKKTWGVEPTSATC